VSFRLTCPTISGVGWSARLSAERKEPSETYVKRSTIPNYGLRYEHGEYDEQPSTFASTGVAAKVCVLHCRNPRVWRAGGDPPLKALWPHR
jgi:hypothetical protein